MRLDDTIHYMTRRHWTAALVLLVVLTAVYSFHTLPFERQGHPLEFLSRQTGLQDELPSIFDTYLVDDSTPIVRQGESLVADGDLSFATQEIPEMLHWRLETSREDREVRVLALDDHLRQWIDDGKLKVDHEHYIVVPTTEPGRYLNTFGVGGSLTAAMPLAALRLWRGAEFSEPATLAAVNRSLAAVCVAVSAVFLFLTMSTFTTIGWSLLLTITYALGTCVWSISSQMLWQHGPVEMYLCAGLYFATRPRRAAWQAGLAGASMAMATLSRPTMAIVAMATLFVVGGKRRPLAAYILGGAPFALFLFWYNAHYLGSPFRFGQTELTLHALEKTGSEEIWQTPLWEGAAGMLLSPSRGLLFFSPVLAFGVWGAARAWRRTQFRWLRPLTLAVLVIWGIEFRHFDWWSGWSYGYRHILDTTPILVLAMLPVLPDLASKRRWQAVFAAALAWSLMVQFVGAFAYDVWGWNGRFRFDRLDRSGHVTASTLDPLMAEAWTREPSIQVQPVMMNIDRPAFRGRLWSLGDNPIDYYFTHFRESAAMKARQMSFGERSRRHRLAETYVSLGDAFEEAGDLDSARDCYRRAVEADPWCESATLRFWEMAAVAGNVRPVEDLLDRLANDQPQDRTLVGLRAFLALERDRLSDAVDLAEPLLIDGDADARRRIQILSAWMRRRFSEPGFSTTIDVERRLGNFNAIASSYCEAGRLERNGDLEAAADVFSRISSDHPDLASPQRQLARIRLLQRRYAESSLHRRRAEHLAWQATARRQNDRTADKSMPSPAQTRHNDLE